jgi:predicted adenylyl cyclase CyaB
MRNIELKARLRDRAAAVAACEAIGAQSHGDIHQIDTYFRVPEGRLKLRAATPGRAELIFYRRPDIAGAKGCDYLLEPMRPAAVEILGEALGILATVAKTRTLYRWENVRIHLDRVTGLGDFLEFEAVMPEGDADDSGYAKLDHLGKALGIAREDTLEFSYLEMILQSTSR